MASLLVISCFQFRGPYETFSEFFTALVTAPAPSIPLPARSQRLAYLPDRAPRVNRVNRVNHNNLFKRPQRLVVIVKVDQCRTDRAIHESSGNLGSIEYNIAA